MADIHLLAVARHDSAPGRERQAATHVREPCPARQRCIGQDRVQFVEELPQAFFVGVQPLDFLRLASHLTVEADKQFATPCPRGLQRFFFLLLVLAQCRQGAAVLVDFILERVETGERGFDGADVFRAGAIQILIIHQHPRDARRVLLIQ